MTSAQRPEKRRRIQSSPSSLNVFDPIGIFSRTPVKPMPTGEEPPSTPSLSQDCVEQHAFPLDPDLQPSHENNHFVELEPKIVNLGGEPENDDQTAPHGNQADWSLENLPGVLYVLRPRSEYAKSRIRVRQTEYAIFGKIVNSFPVLPSQISSKVEGWRLEAWMRIDRRITAQDIIDRVNPKHTITEDEIELRRQHFRQEFHIACWGAQRSICEIERMLKAADIDIARNTTRGLTPGFIDPSKGEEGGRIPIPAIFHHDLVAGVEMQSFLHSPQKPNEELGSPTSISYEKPRRPQVQFQFALINQGVNMKGTDHTTNRRKRKRHSTKNSPKFEPKGYPDMLYDLAYHDGPPARTFSMEPEPVVDTMEFEEYLDRSQLSFQEYLCRDPDDSHEVDIKRQDYGQNSNFVTPVKKGNTEDPWASVSRS